MSPSPGQAAPSQGEEPTSPTPPASTTLTVDAPSATTARSGGNYVSGRPVANNAVGTVTWAWAPGSTPPSWASVDPATGIVTGTAGNYGTFPNLALQARDSTGVSRTVPFELKVLPPPAASVPSDATETLMRVGGTFDLTPAGSNVAGTPSWSIPWISGSLPNGLSLDSATGTVSGTMNGAGSARFPLLLTDSYDHAEATTAPVSVMAYPRLAFAQSARDIAVRPGGNVSASPPNLLNRIGAVSYVLRGTQEPASTLGGACPGLRFDPSSGNIVGTPTSPCGLNGLSLVAYDDGNGATRLRDQATSSTFGLRINSGLFADAQPGSPTARRGTVTSTTAGIGGTPYGTLTWSVATSDGSALPSWISKAAGTCTPNATTCGLSVSPTATTPLGVYPASGTIGITAADEGGSTVGFAPVRVAVGETAVQAGTATTSYSGRINQAQTTTPVAATGGTAPYKYAIETLSGTAPSNATVSATNGAVTYTPDRTGTWLYRVRVTSASDDANTAWTPQVSVVMDPSFQVSVADITLHATSNFYTYTAVNNTAMPVVTGAKGKVTWGKPTVANVTIDPDTNLVTVSNQFQLNGNLGYTVVATDTADGSKSTLAGMIRRLTPPSIANRQLSLLVRRGLPYRSYSLAMNPTIGMPSYPVYSLAMVTYDGSTQYQSCGDGTLLDGFELGQDGYVTGTYQGPITTQGGFLKSACYRATDYDGAYAGTGLNFWAADPLQLTGLPSTVQLRKGVDYSGAINLLNAQGKVTWATSGTRPPGISAIANGSSINLSGRPSDAQTYVMTFTATDAWDGTNASFTVTFVGNP